MHAARLEIMDWLHEFEAARRDRRWRCVHSHVSLLPSQPERAHGRL